MLERLEARKPTLADETVDGSLFVAYVDICTVLADITKISVEGTTPLKILI